MARAKPHHTSEPLLKASVKRPQILVAVLVLASLLGIYVVYVSRAATGTLSLSPASSNVGLGSTVTVTIHENSGTDPINAVESDLSYDQTKLQFVSIDTSSSPFSNVIKTGGSGTVSIVGAIITTPASSVTGDQIVATVTFTAIGTGAAAVNFANTSQLIRSSDQTNVLVTTTGGTYTVADTTAPAVPTGLAAPTKTTTSVGLTWTASTDNVGVTGYKIYRAGVQIGTSATTSYTDNGLTPNTAYSYSVAAYDAAGNTSAQTAAVSATTLPDTAAPSAPGGLTLGTRTVTSIAFSWTASTDNVAVTGYKIFRGGTQIATSSSPSYTNTGLTPNTAYSFTVAAVDGSGNTSAQSTALATSTLADTIAPSVPTGLSSSLVTGTTLTLSWTASTDNVAVTGYKIFRGGTQVGTSSTASFNDSGLTAGSSYSYTVAAVDGSGNTSSQSVALPVTTITKPGDVNGDTVVNSIDLSILAANYGKTGASRAMGDLNGDTFVNTLDLSILAANWGM